MDVLLNVLNVLLISRECVVTTVDSWLSKKLRGVWDGLHTTLDFGLNFINLEEFWDGVHTTDDFGLDFFDDWLDDNRCFVVEVGVAIIVVDVGGAGLDDLLLVLNQTQEVGVVLNDSVGEVVLPLEDLVVLDHDLLAVAARGAVVGFFVELNEPLVDDGSLGTKLVVDLVEHVAPLNQQVCDELSADLVSALDTGFTDVRQVLVLFNPCGNELGGEVFGEGFSSIVGDKVSIVESIPLNSTEVIGNEILDLIVGPHLVDGVRRLDRLDGRDRLDWFSFGDLIGGGGVCNQECACEVFVHLIDYFSD